MRIEHRSVIGEYRVRDCRHKWRACGSEAFPDEWYVRRLSHFVLVERVRTSEWVSRPGDQKDQGEAAWRVPTSNSSTREFLVLALGAGGRPLSFLEIRYKADFASGCMALFEVLDFTFYFILGVVDGLADLAASPIGMLARGIVVRVADLFRRIFRVSPGFLDGTFSLVGDPFVCQVVVSDGFPNALLHFSNRLIDLAGHLIFIHKSPFYPLFTLRCERQNRPYGEFSRTSRFQPPQSEA
jgi:hypothetical protein